MTPEARTGAPFELLRFSAAPVTGALVVLELDGRFHLKGRFARRPHLVIEPGEGRRIELAPVRTEVDGIHWHGTYAVPADALTDAARLGLGVRGTLLELPAPDEPDDGERLTAVAREANGLRRALEAAEAEAAAARAEAAAAAAALVAAVAAAREDAAAQSAERIDALEREVVEAHRLSALDVEAARTTAIADVTARAEAAEQHAEQAEARARAAEERAELAEQAQSAALESTPEEGDVPDDATLTMDMAASIDLEARAVEAEQEAELLRERLAAAEAGTEVLRAELAEERERAQAAVARADALRNAAAAEGVWPEAAGHERPAGDEPAPDPDETHPFTVAEQRDADVEATQPYAPGAAGDTETNGGRHTEARPSTDAEVRRRAGIFDPLPADASEHRRHGPNLSPWIAVGALLLFAIALLILLFG